MTELTLLEAAKELQNVIAGKQRLTGYDTQALRVVRQLVVALGKASFGKEKSGLAKKAQMSSRGKAVAKKSKRSARDGTPKERRAEGAVSADSEVKQSGD